jgi:hypothetical protein
MEVPDEKDGVRYSPDGKGLTCLTPEEGHHQATYTDDMAYLIDTFSTFTAPPVSVLRSAKDGRVMMMLEKADRSVIQSSSISTPVLATNTCRSRSSSGTGEWPSWPNWGSSSYSSMR